MKQTFKILRIICCIIDALILAAAVFIFIFLGWKWGLLSIVIAAAFFGLMMIFKTKQEQLEEKEHPTVKGDFITGAVKNENRDNSPNSTDKNE